jgi:antirestriction protein ArdC
MKAAEIQQEALAHATGSQSLMNYPTIFEGFMAKGIAESDITPRVNVFTFNAWRALGRTVRKGEHGVKVCTFVPVTKKTRDPSTGEESEQAFRKPHTTTVFHISQTSELAAKDR